MLVGKLAATLRQARREGKREGLEEAANLASNIVNIRGAQIIAAAIRALIDKEPSDG